MAKNYSIVYASGSDFPEGWYVYKDGYLVGPFEEKQHAEQCEERIIE